VFGVKLTKKQDEIITKAKQIEEETMKPENMLKLLFEVSYQRYQDEKEKKDQVKTEIKKAA
jgi:hypothetical protein